MKIPRAEFRERQARAVRQARERGLQGLIVWSRGGSTQDRYGDVLYLANYYPLFPNIPDFPPFWRGRGHAVLLLPVDGAPVLLSDEPEDAHRKDWAVDDGRFAPDLLGIVLDAIREKDLGRAQLGIVGYDVLPVGWYREILREFPAIRMVDADDILMGLRMMKSDAELAVIAQGGRRASKVLQAGLEDVVPGRTERDVAAVLAEEVIRGSLCFRDLVISSGKHSTEYAHGRLPSWDAARELKRGELFHVDLECSFQGYYYDMARTVCVGRKASGKMRKALDASVECVDRVIDGIHEGAFAEELGRIGFDHLKRGGYLEGFEGSDFPAMGHGMGLGWERPYLAPGDRTRIRPNMYLAVEDGVYVDGQGTMHEENLLVTRQGLKLLSTAEKVWW